MRKPRPLSIEKLAAKSAVRFRRAREESELTRTVAAKRLGMSEQTLYYIESGRRPPSIMWLYRASLLYGLSTDWLLGMTDATP